MTDNAALVVGGPCGAEEHTAGDHHPERPARVAAAMAGVADLGLGDAMRLVPPADVTMAQLTAVHDPEYLAELEARSARGGGELDPDTFLTHSSWTAARAAAGAGLATVAALAAQGDGVGFVAARPPGHHATANRGMGFCLLNNIAIAAAALVAEGQRVLVLDWDVHHGNGTQAIFWNEPAVLYVSTHQFPLFPGTGRPHEVGGTRAPGLNVDLPLPAGATGDVLHRALDEVAAPVIEAFAPTWVLVSAGFDAHRADPLAELALSSGDFATLARTAAGYAPEPGRVVLFLEGGYDLRALRGSVEASLGALLGAAGEPELPTSGGPGGEAVARIKEEYREARDRVAAMAAVVATDHEA